MAAEEEVVPAEEEPVDLVAASSALASALAFVRNNLK